MPFQLPNPDFRPLTFHLPPSTFHLQPSAFSLQPNNISNNFSRENKIFFFLTEFFNSRFSFCGFYLRFESVILGQLIQTGRRFCECRSQDFIPLTDALHTIIAYNADDRFVARSIDEHAKEPELILHDWLTENAALAYVLISLNYNPDQGEFPPPLGRTSTHPITITASMPEGMQHATYEVIRCHQNEGAKLYPVVQRLPSQCFARRNFFLSEVSIDPIPTANSETPFFGDRILVYN